MRGVSGRALASCDWRGRGAWERRWRVELCARLRASGGGRRTGAAEPGTDQRGDREMNVPCPPVVVAVVRVGQLD